MLIGIDAAASGWDGRFGAGPKVTLDLCHWQVPTASTTQQAAKSVPIG